MRCVLLYSCIIFSVFQIGCARSGLRVLGGKDADEVKHPYIVRLQHQIVIFNLVTIILHIHSCTGSLLTPTWTLTAAHCLSLKGPKKTETAIMQPVIRCGTFKESLIVRIIAVIEHPGYKFRILDIRNDIGLIKSYPVPVNQFARLSALDFASLVGEEAALFGYGLTNGSDPTGQTILSDATTAMKPLQQLDIVVLQCSKNYVDMMPAVCVARRCGQSASICPGDSGGPMIHSSGIVGVNSLGPLNLNKFCYLKPSAPVFDAGVITPVSPFIDWISETIVKDIEIPPETKS